jgi:hypothetical protein
VTNSSPTLSADIVRAGDAATAIGLRVVESGLTTAAPVVTGGTYTSFGVAGGTAIAVSLEASSPSFNMVQIGGTSGISVPVATTAYGVRCTDCGGTTFSGGRVTTSGATTTGYGLHGSGDLTGLTASTTNFGGGQTSATGSTSTGIRLDTCTGAPSFTGSNTDGGFPGTVAMTTRIAILSSGAACAPVVDGGRHIGCELGVNCEGIDCNTGSQCVVRNATLITGTVGTADTSFGVRCLGGGCASIRTSTINAGNLSRSGPTGIGLEIDGASPTVDDCAITGPNGGNIAVATARWHSVYLRSTSSTISNCIIASGSHAQPQQVVRYDQTSLGPALIAPTIVNDTIEYASCTTCGGRTGLAIFGSPGALISPMGIVRNNIIRHVGVGGVTNPVVELNVQSDLQSFDNNALWDPTASMGAIYLDEGTMPLATALQINALMPAGSSTNNLVVDCVPNASWHIPAGSACRNAGTALSCPRADFTAQVRPNAAICDIGADEFYP